MRRISIILLTICFIIISGCSSEPKESSKVTYKEAKSITVYITKTGECYHNDYCSCLSKSKIAKDLKTASKNYRACQLCYPPIIEE